MLRGKRAGKGEAGGMNRAMQPGNCRPRSRDCGGQAQSSWTVLGTCGLVGRVVDSSRQAPAAGHLPGTANADVLLNPPKQKFVAQRQIEDAGKLFSLATAEVICV